MKTKLGQALIKGLKEAVEMKQFEVANSNDIDSIIEASKNAVLNSMKDVVYKMKETLGETPGLTWDQIDFLIDEFLKKKAEVIHQEYEG